MRVRFWGTRGSVPTPGPATVRFGGNTSCVEMRTSANTLFIFDSGTGIREFGLHLLGQGNTVNGHIMLGHTHWDHISGFPFFTPAFIPGNTFKVYGARDLNHSLEEVLAGQMHYTYFPVPLGDLRANLTFQELDEGQVQIDDARIHTMYLNHTAVCMGYRIEADGVSVAYITDHEPHEPVSSTPGDSDQEANPSGAHFLHAGDQRLIEFVRGVDLLIQDCQYTPDEYRTKRGWGHGASDYVTDIAVAAQAQQLALFHHEPTHSDAQLDEMVAFCRNRARKAGASLHVFAAAEGQIIEFPPSSP